MLSTTHAVVLLTDIECDASNTYEFLSSENTSGTTHKHTHTILHTNVIILITVDIIHI